MVVVEPSGNADVIVTGTAVTEGLPDGALAPALVLPVTSATGTGELESADGVVATGVGEGDSVAEGVSAADALDEMALGSVATEVELAPEVVVTPVVLADVVCPPAVVTPALADMVCPPAVVCVSVWPGGAAEPSVESLLGAAMTESFPPPELDGGGGGGGDWPDGRTTYLHSLSSRTDWAPSPPGTGVRVTLQVCVIVPSLCRLHGLKGHRL